MFRIAPYYRRTRRRSSTTGSLNASSEQHVARIQIIPTANDIGPEEEGVWYALPGTPPVLLPQYASLIKASHRITEVQNEWYVVEAPSTATKKKQATIMRGILPDHL